MSSYEFMIDSKYIINSIVLQQDTLFRSLIKLSKVKSMFIGLHTASKRRNHFQSRSTGEGVSSRQEHY